MKGPSEKGDQFAVLEYMKAGQVVTHPVPPFKRLSSSFGPRPLPRNQPHHRKKGFQAEHLQASHASLLVRTWV